MDFSQITSSRKLVLGNETDSEMSIIQQWCVLVIIASVCCDYQTEMLLYNGWLV